MSTSRLLIAVLLLAGCASTQVSGRPGAARKAPSWTVKAHQREQLADRIMSIEGDPQALAAEQHILSNREGAIGGTGTSGGGCGCN